MPNRRIVTNQPDYAVTDNTIVTSKYSVFDFIPLSLLVQFSKLPNIYFLIIGLMQMVPSITNSGGFPVIFIPLSMVVSVSMLKDLF
jgi:phospholipid-transporting ATPase